MKDRKDIIQGEKHCPVCNKDLSGMRITDVGNHIKWCKFKSNPDNTYSQAMKKANATRFGAFASYKVTCNKCGTEFEVRQREHSFPKKKKYFCSISCANSRSNLSQSWTQQKKEKARVRSKKLWQNEQYISKQLNRPKFYTSKVQRKIRDYIVQNYKDDQWTWGSLAFYKDEFRLNPDLFSHKLKFVFQYDGEWHFKDIKKDGKFEKIQYKDKCLEDWCQENNYHLLRVSQSWFFQNNKDEKLVFSIINQMLNQNDTRCLKLGKQYINVG